MVLALPGRVLALSMHLGDAYPEALREPANAELVEFLARFSRPRRHPTDAAHATGRDLHQPMHTSFTVPFAFHLREALARPPFTPEQVASFNRGIVPDGEL